MKCRVVTRHRGSKCACVDFIFSALTLKVYSVILILRSLYGTNEWIGVHTNTKTVFPKVPTDYDVELHGIDFYR